MKYLMTAAALALIALPAQAQNCVPHKVLELEMEKTGAHRIFAGNSANGHVTEIWVNETANEWAAFIVRNASVACLVDSGVGILTVKPVGVKL